MLTALKEDCDYDNDDGRREGIVSPPWIVLDETHSDWRNPIDRKLAVLPSTYENRQIMRAFQFVITFSIRVGVNEQANM